MSGKKKATSQRTRGAAKIKAPGGAATAAGPERPGLKKARAAGTQSEVARHGLPAKGKAPAGTNTAKRKVAAAAGPASQRSVAGGPVRPALETARRVFAIEGAALAEVAERLGADIEKAVELVVACRGRVVVTGMGKSGQICRKIAATLSSTGTAAFFLHAGEAVHGDLGMFARGDVCIAISNSGTTEELLALLPSIERLGLPLIAITGGLDSPLARAADAVLDVRVREEACPMGLAPTASTTAMLAMGDALAVAALESNGFGEQDFALLHPGGALGRRLLRVRDVMRTLERVPLVDTGLPMPETLARMTSGGLGTVGVIDEAGALVGVVTDGDLRRGVLRHGDLSALRAEDLMTRKPKTVDRDALAARALATMERHEITALFIVETGSGKPAGIVHLHDLLKAGIA